MTRMKVFLAVAGLAGLLPLRGAMGETPTRTSLYHLSKTVPLGAPDRWDYLLYEPASRRLYAAHGTSVDILDGRSGERIGRVPVPGANGVALALDVGKGYAGKSHQPGDGCV